MTKYIGHKRQIDSKLQRYTTNYSDAKNLIDFLGGERTWRGGGKNKRRRNFCLLGAKNETSLPQKLSRAVNHILSYYIYVMYVVHSTFLESIYVLSITTNRKVAPSGVINRQPKNGQSGSDGGGGLSHLPAFRLGWAARFFLLFYAGPSKREFSSQGAKCCFS